MADAAKSRTALYVIIGVGILVASVAVWYFFLRGGPKCDPSRNGFDAQGNPNPKCQFSDPATTGEPSPAGTSGWVSDSTFPIKKGSWGPKVAALQTAIGASSDGKFGPQTESKLIAKTGKAEVSNAADYDKIINPPASGGGNNFQELKNALAGASTNFSEGVSYLVPGQNNNYRFDFYAKNGRWILYQIGAAGSWERGTYYEGGKRMSVDGKKTFNGTPQANMIAIVKEYGK